MIDTEPSQRVAELQTAGAATYDDESIAAGWMRLFG